MWYASICTVLAVTNRVEGTQSTQFVFWGKERGQLKERWGGGASKIVAFEGDVIELSRYFYRMKNSRQFPNSSSSPWRWILTNRSDVQYIFSRCHLTLCCRTSPELSEVLWNMVLHQAFAMKGALGLVATFATFAMWAGKFSRQKGRGDSILSSLGMLVVPF